MKRFLCLALTVAMILSFATFSAFAADVTGVLKITGDNGKVGDVLTISYTIKGAETLYAWQGVFSYAHNIIVPADSTNTAIKYKSNGEATAANVKKSFISSVLSDKFTADEYDGDYEDSSIWGQTVAMASYDKNTNLGIYQIAASAANSEAEGSPAIVSADGYTAFSARFVRIAEGDIAFVPKTAALICKAEITDASGNVLTDTTVDYTAPGGDEPEDWKGTVVDGKPSDATIEDSDFKFPTKTDDRDSDSKDTTVITRKAVMFAKAVDKLDAETYGIKIGDFFYPGIAEVPAGSYWSIVLVTTDDEALKGSYEYIPMIKTNAVGAELEGTEKADAKTLVVAE